MAEKLKLKHCKVEFEGSYNDGKVSAARPVRVTLEEPQLLRVTGADINRTVALQQCKLSPPLGKTQRYLELGEGDRIEVSDLEALEDLTRLFQGPKSLSLIHRLESHGPTVLLILVAMVAFVGLSYKYGIPLLAKYIASSIPPKVNRLASEQTLSIFDQTLFEPSALRDEEKQALRQKFEALALSLGQGTFDYQLEFRASPTIGANAFALPSGTIVITDDLITEAEDDREILAVLAHEIIHVERHHGMRSVLQNAGAFFILSLLLGDITSVTSLGAALPTLLAESNYSREFEREADEAAGRYCIAQGWSTAPLRKVLLRMASGEEDIPGAALIATHPETSKRIDTLLQLEEESSE